METSVEQRTRVRPDVRWTPIVAGIGLIACGVLPAFFAAALAPRIGRDFAFGDQAIGTTIAAFYTACAIMSWFSGGWIERLGLTRSLRFSGVAIAAGCLGAAALAQSAVALTALIVATSVGNALVTPCVSAMLKRDLPPERHGLAMGGLQGGAPFGAVLAGLALPAIAIPFGWRWAFVLAAVVTLACALLATRGERDDRVALAVAPRSRAAGPRTGVGPVRMLALAAAFGSVCSLGLVSFLVVYAVDNGMSEHGAGLLLSGTSVLAMLSRVGFGALGDRPRFDPILIAAVMLGSSAAAVLLLLAATPLAIVAAALVAVGVGWGWAGPMTLAAVRFSPESPAWAVGVLMAGLFAGAVVGPLVVGVLADRDAFTAAWLLCSGCAALAAGALLTARRW